MIVGIGLDICSIERMSAMIERRPGVVGRLFTPAESHVNGRLRPVASLAARFAAKEALAKALGAPGGLRWSDARLLSDPDGQPRFEVSGSVAVYAAARGVTKILVSLSHDRGIAVAYVICEGKP